MQFIKFVTFDDMSGVLLSSKHSGGKYLQATRRISMMVLIKIGDENVNEKRKEVDHFATNNINKFLFKPFYKNQHTSNIRALQILEKKF